MNIKGLMKKAIAVILGITIVFGTLMLPQDTIKNSFITAGAYTVGYNDCTFTYELKGDEDGIKTLIITGVESHGEKVEIPSVITYEGKEYPVEKIGDQFLRYDETVKIVIFPDTVKDIGSDVLVHSSVENIVLPDDLENLGIDFASFCDNIKSVRYSGTKLKDVGFFHFRNSDISCLKNEKGATCLGNWLIKYEGKLDSTTLKPADLGSNGVKIENICLNVFADTSNITNLDLEGIKRIDANSFNNCAALRTILNADDLIYIGAYAFEDCKDLQNILDADNVETLREGAFSGTPWYDNARKKGLVRVGKVLEYYNTDSDTIDLTSGELKGIKLVKEDSMTECKNVVTLRCDSDCILERGCLYITNEIYDDGRYRVDPLPIIPKYNIKNVYVDGKKLTYKLLIEDEVVKEWLRNNSNAFDGAEFLKIMVEEKTKVLFKQLDITYYGMGNDKIGTLSPAEEFSIRLKIHDYISIFQYGNSGDNGGFVYAMLIGDVLMCDGYAEMTHYLLECAGVESKTFYSSAPNSDGVHFWNGTKIGDEWFVSDDGWDAQNDAHGYGWLLNSYSAFHTSEFHEFDVTYDSFHFTPESRSNDTIPADRFLGDIDGDNDRDKDDSPLLWAYVKGETDTIDKKAADINFDDVIDVKDAVLLDHLLYSKALNPYKVPDDGLAPGFMVLFMNGDDYKSITYTFTDRDGYITLPEQPYKVPEGKVMRYDIGKVGERVKIHDQCTVIRAQWVDPSELEDILGDVNDDKNIDIEDAVAIIQHINGLTPLTESEEKRADVSKDKTIDIDDAVMLISYINGNSVF